jgi:hypothetical protein
VALSAKNMNKRIAGNALNYVKNVQKLAMSIINQLHRINNTSFL